MTAGGARAGIVRARRGKTKGYAGQKQSFRVVWRRHWMIYVMMLAAAVPLVVFYLYPLWGLGVAFVRFSPFKGLARSPFVGLDNFRRFLTGRDAVNVVRNTLVIASGKIVVGQFVALAFALALNEVRSSLFKRTVQTATTFPHFLSWVLVGGIMMEVLGGTGLINRAIESAGLPPVKFFLSPPLFPWTLVALETWKGFGWGAVIYLAALTGINPELYEAAAVDGAGRWGRMWYVSIPGISSTIALLGCLSLGGILSAGFEQVLVFLNPVVYSTGDILDTYIYRVGLLTGEFGVATAAGVFKSVIGFGLVWFSYWLADRYAGYRVF